MDLFRLLGSGAKFDKKRFQADVQLFEGKRKAEKAQTKNAAATDPELRAQLLSEIDILSDGDQRSKQNEQKGEEQDETIDLPTTVPGTPTVFETVEEANQFRKRHRIKIYGDDVPNPFATFEDLASAPYNLLPTLYNNIKQSKYATPTPIQMQSIPIMMKGRDVIGCAPTGSGKTLAYLLPILQDLKEPKKAGYRALIIAPTRELAQQIDRELHKIGAGLKFKVNLMTKATAAHKAQTPQSRQKFDILISTPLRLVHAIQEKEVDLSKVRHLVLDEADKLLELGFLEQTDEIFAACSNDARKALFSATFSTHVEDLATSVMKSPVRVVVGSRNAATDTIKQQLIYVGSEAGKLFEIRQLVAKGIKPPVLIFVQSIERAKELFHELVYDGINVDVIHSDRTKTQRENIINSFRQGKIWVLIATELMARGLDFKGVNLVINYDFPQSSASYIHRIGRTGRAGRMGEAVTYYTKDDLQYLKSIVNVMRESGCEVPDWMLHLKNPTHQQKKELRKGVEREAIDTTPKFDKRKEKMRKEMIDASKKRKKKQKQNEQQQKNKKAKTEENNTAKTTSSPSSSSS